LEARQKCQRTEQAYLKLKDILNLIELLLISVFRSISLAIGYFGGAGSVVQEHAQKASRQGCLERSQLSATSGDTIIHTWQ
jgi:hypothetical protein